MAKKLYYFNLDGVAESIRYILYYKGEKFEDIRYPRDQWPLKEVKEALPFGQLPVYEEGDRKINQSLAICRYLGGKYDLLPSDLWEQALLDAAVNNVLDLFRINFTKVRSQQDPVQKEKNAKEMLKNDIPFFFSRFEKMLQENNGHFGKKLSWADFYIVGILDYINLNYGLELQKDYPALSGLFEEIKSLPGVKEYIAKRGPYALPQFK